MTINPSYLLIIILLTVIGCSTTKKQPVKEETTEEQIKELLDNVDVTVTQKPKIPKEEFTFSFYEDFESILEKTQNPESPIYIEKLLSKFQKGESFTKMERIGLMVGGTSLPGYQDSRLEIMYAEIDSILLNLDNDKTNAKEEKIERVIELSDSCIAIFPLSIEGIVGNYYGYGKKNNSEKEKAYFGKGNIVFQSMLKTGNFNNKEKPYIGFGNTCIYWYCMGFAQAGYKKVSEDLDSNGNIVQGYKNMLGETDYYLIPKKKIKN